MKNIAFIKWFPKKLAIVTSRGETIINSSIKEIDRYGIQLNTDMNENLFIRIPENNHLFIFNTLGRNLIKKLILPKAISGKISLFKIKFHPFIGKISLLHENHVWIYDIKKEFWESRKLPNDMQVNEISLSYEGGVWYAGSRNSQSLPYGKTKLSLVQQIEGDRKFIRTPLSMNLINTIKLVAQGGYSEFRTVDGIMEPIICTANCFWLLEDNSSFVFIIERGKTIFKRFKGELICFIDRSKENIIRVITHGGNIWSYTNKKWTKHYFVPAINFVLPVKNRKILIRKADVLRNRIALVIELAPENIHDFGQNPDYTALCTSEDSGLTFHTQNILNFKTQGELIDVVLFNDKII